MWASFVCGASKLFDIDEEQSVLSEYEGEYSVGSLMGCCDIVE